MKNNPITTARREKYFAECRLKYEAFRQNYMEKVEEQKALICKQVKAKGKKYNVIPYKEERLGNKLNGREVAEIEMKDGYCVYSYDEEGRIRLVEHACTSLEKFYNFECYDYIGDKVYTYSCSLISCGYVGVSIFEGDRIKETYKIYGDNRCSYDKYIYEDATLTAIDVCIQDISGEIRNWREKFFYEKKKKLTIIQHVEGGHRRNYYCDRKINYKKAEGAIKDRVKELCSKKYQKNTTIKVTVLRFSLESVHAPTINITFETESGQTWQEEAEGHPDGNGILLREAPLDDFEAEKVIHSILRATVNMWEEGVLAEDIQLEVTKDGSNILEEKYKLPRWLKNDSQLYFLEEKIGYKDLKDKEKTKKQKPKNIKEIYKDMKGVVSREENLQKQLEIFEKMSKIPVGDNPDAEGEDVFIMKAEQILFEEKLMFAFSLIRQIPSGDEFVQLGLDVIYESSEGNKKVAETYWSDEVEGNFFFFIKNTEIYKSLHEEKVCDVRVFLEET